MKTMSILIVVAVSGILCTAPCNGEIRKLAETDSVSTAFLHRIMTPGLVRLAEATNAATWWTPRVHYYNTAPPGRRTPSPRPLDGTARQDYGTVPPGYGAPPQGYGTVPPGWGTPVGYFSFQGPGVSGVTRSPSGPAVGTTRSLPAHRAYR